MSAGISNKIFAGGGSPYERFAERLAHVDAAQIDVYADIKRSKPRSFRETIL